MAMCGGAADMSLGDGQDEVGPGLGREHPRHEGSGGLHEVPAERLHEGLDLFLGVRRGQLVVGVDPDEAGDAFAEPERGLDDDVATHRMADEHHVRQAEVIDHGDDVLAERRHGPGGPSLPGLPVAREIDRHDAMAVRERAGLFSPVGPIA